MKVHWSAARFYTLLSVEDFANSTNMPIGPVGKGKQNTWVCCCYGKKKQKNTVRSMKLFKEKLPRFMLLYQHLLLAPCRSGLRLWDSLCRKSACILWPRCSMTHTGAFAPTWCIRAFSLGQRRTKRMSRIKPSRREIKQEWESSCGLTVSLWHLGPMEFPLFQRSLPRTHESLAGIDIISCDFKAQGEYEVIKE